MTDPDAPSRENPEWSEICHWVVTNVPFDSKDDQVDADDISANSPKDVMPYKPPGPPPKTWKHRYVFVALAPRNLTTKALDLKKPDDRQHWGFDNERDGLRKWADEMELEVVGEQPRNDTNEIISLLTTKQEQTSSTRRTTSKSDFRRPVD